MTHRARAARWCPSAQLHTRCDAGWRRRCYGSYRAAGRRGDGRLGGERLEQLTLFGRQLGQLRPGGCEPWGSTRRARSVLEARVIRTGGSAHGGGGSPLPASLAWPAPPSPPRAAPHGAVAAGVVHPDERLRQHVDDLGGGSNGWWCSPQHLDAAAHRFWGWLEAASPWTRGSRRRRSSPTRLGRPVEHRPPVDLRRGPGRGGSRRERRPAPPPSAGARRRRST